MATKEKILVVDDDQTIREGLQALLKGEGFLVESASDGEEALSKMAKMSFDVVVTDLDMPKKNGCQLAQEVKIQQTEGLLPLEMLLILSTARDEESLENDPEFLEAESLFAAVIFNKARNILEVAPTIKNLLDN